MRRRPFVNQPLLLVVVVLMVVMLVMLLAMVTAVRRLRGGSRHKENRANC